LYKYIISDLESLNGYFFLVPRGHPAIRNVDATERFLIKAKLPVRVRQEFGSIRLRRVHFSERFANVEQHVNDCTGAYELRA
jgi:hypothetical protein